MRDKQQIYQELLVVRCKQGDRQALEELIGLWESRLLYFIRRLVDNEQDACDVLQQTWLKTIRRIGSLRDPGRFAPWLYRIARNTALNHGRLQAAYRQALRHEQNGYEFEEAPASIEFEHAEQVHQALQRLSLPHREVMTLFFLQDLSVEQIAQVLQVPPGTVKSRLHYARQALKQMLTEQGPEHD